MSPFCVRRQINLAVLLVSATALFVMACAPQGVTSETGGASATGGSSLGSGGAVSTGGATISGTGGMATGGFAPTGGANTGGSRTGGTGSGGTAGRPSVDAGSSGGSRGPGIDASVDGGAVSGSDGAPPSDAGSLPGWNLVWSDEFDQAGAPNAANWRFENGFVRNMELQWYQTANATVADGMLTIEGKREQVTNPNYMAGSTDWKRSRETAAYTSSSITSSGKRFFTYGRFESRARIDVRQGSWPAFWILGTTGGWPGGGEVDIMEFYASKVLANVCKPAGSTCGWSSVTKSVSSLGANWANDFHVWVMEWDATKIDLYLDGELMNHFNIADAVATGTANPYVGKAMYIVLNLALGSSGGDPANTTFPIKYQVDYVRVYQRPAAAMFQHAPHQQR